MEIIDPLEQVENAVKSVHQVTRQRFQPLYRKYPILLLLVITVSVAAIFHGLDIFLDRFYLFKEYPLILVLVGILGLLITGNLYTRLGGDKFEN